MSTAGKINYPLVSSTHVLQTSSSHDVKVLLLKCPLDLKKMITAEPETQKTV